MNGAVLTASNPINQATADSALSFAYSGVNEATLTGMFSFSALENKKQLTFGIGNYTNRAVQFLELNGLPQLSGLEHYQGYEGFMGGINRGDIYTEVADWQKAQTYKGILSGLGECPAETAGWPNPYGMVNFTVGSVNEGNVYGWSTFGDSSVYNHPASAFCVNEGFTSYGKFLYGSANLGTVDVAEFRSYLYDYNNYADQMAGIHWAPIVTGAGSSYGGPIALSGADYGLKAYNEGIVKVLQTQGGAGLHNKASGQIGTTAGNAPGYIFNEGNIGCIFGGFNSPGAHLYNTGTIKYAVVRTGGTNGWIQSENHGTITKVVLLSSEGESLINNGTIQHTESWLQHSQRIYDVYYNTMTEAYVTTGFNQTLTANDLVFAWTKNTPTLSPGDYLAVVTHVSAVEVCGLASFYEWWTHPSDYSHQSYFAACNESFTYNGTNYTTNSVGIVRYA